MKTTLSAGKRLADDEAARLLDAANGVPAVDNDQLREQIAEFAKAVTDGMGRGTAFDSQWTMEHAINWAKGGGNVSNLPKSYTDWRDELTHGYKAARGILAPSDEPAEVSIGRNREDGNVSDALKTLWDSTAEFHERFDTMKDTYAFIRAQWRVFMEEVAEFGLEAIGDVLFTDNEPAHMEQELADVIVVGIGLLLAHGRRLEELQAAIRAVAAKNDAKTTETHAKDAKGKVARKTA